MSEENIPQTPAAAPDTPQSDPSTDAPSTEAPGTEANPSPEANEAATATPAPPPVGGLELPEPVSRTTAETLARLADGDEGVSAEAEQAGAHLAQTVEAQELGEPPQDAGQEAATLDAGATKSAPIDGQQERTGDPEDAPADDAAAAESASPESTDAGIADVESGAVASESVAEPAPADVSPSETPTPSPTPEPPAPASTPTPLATAPPTPTPSETPMPAAAPIPVPAPPAAGAPTADSTRFGRVDDDGTVYVRTPEGERPVGSYPGASAQEALAYFARKFDEVDALADLLYQRVTQTDLSAKDAADSLANLRQASRDLHAVGDFVALQAKVENIATALEARKIVDAEQRAAAREQAMAQREEIVAEAERIAAQPENKVQWKASSARMRALLDEWKAAQRGGPKLDRESEQALWQRLSSSRNSFDKMRRVHFAQLGSAQSQAKAAKEELVAEAEKLVGSTDWGATAGAYKRLMDRWRQAGRAARGDDDALWKRFKAAQDQFFAAKDSVVAAENEEFKANLVVKEELLTQAQQLLPVKNVESAKAALRTLQEKWDAAGKVPRSDMDRMERGMRRIEQAVRDAEDKRWKSSNPEVAARAASLASQAEAALEKYRKDLAKAEASGDQRRIAKAREALEAREGWLKQARAGLAEFGG